MRRTEQKARTRESLKRAARERFAAGAGLELSIAALARAAGVASGTFYVHFPSKDALIAELLADFNALFAARMAELWPGQSEALRDPSAMLAQLAGGTLDFWSEHKALLEVFLRHAAARGDLRALREGIAPPVALFVGAGLQALAEALGGQLEEPQLVVHGLLGMWTRIGLQYLFSGNVRREAAVVCLCRLTEGAVRAVLPPLPSAMESSDAHAR